MGIGELEFIQNCITVRDFNTTMHPREKRGGSIVRDSSREKLENLIYTLDLIDVHPSKGRFTWNNRRACPWHIAVRLDCFLIHSSCMSLPDSISSLIVLWESSNHRTISLSFLKKQNLGPIPFLFNPLWMDNTNLFPLVSRYWCQWIYGSHVHIS